MKIIPNLSLFILLAAFVMIASCSKEEDKTTDAKPTTNTTDTESSTSAPAAMEPATTAPATTALPPNHPAMPQTIPTTMPQQAMATPPANPGQAKVLTLLHASGYTYMEVELGNKKTWVAATSLKIKAGDTVQWESASVMNNFTSKTLRRTFDEILFVSKASAVE